ncbi:MAG: HlyD family efflux transporter periplasmic adaptor subunit [Candidatus Binataceae bacterium]
MSATSLRKPEPAKAPTSRHWARAVGRTLSGILILAAVSLGYFIYQLYYANPRTDDAYVHANTAALAAHVSGQIVQLPIRDNQHVNKDDLLFVVDPRPYKLALDTATTKFNLTEIEIKTLQDTINSATAQLTERRVEAANAKQYLDRIVPLLAHDFVTDNDVVEARNKLKAAEAAVASASAELRKAQDALGMLGDVNQRLRAAQEGVEDAKLNSDYCFVRAPFDGYVTNLNISAGQYANLGQPVLVLVDDRKWYVLAYFREDQLNRIQPGMRADVSLLSYPDKHFQGEVEGIGWGLFQENGATVGGLPNVEETLNWVRLNQRFPVRIVLTHSDSAHPFRMGQTAVVTIRNQ